MTNTNDFQVEEVNYFDYVTTVPIIEKRLRKSLSRELISHWCVDHMFTKEGLCAANPDDISQSRDFKWHIDNVINPLVKSGEISDGSDSPFDDRKLRYNTPTLIPLSSVRDRTSFTLPFGITHYKAFQADQNRSDEENLALQKRGEELFGDKYAFFSRAPGIAVLPITKEGSVFIGERTNEDAKGLLNAVAGHLKYRHPEKVDLNEDLLAEMEEEFGLLESSLIERPFFAGVYSNPIKGDLDFTYIAQTDAPDEYFSSGRWMEKVSEREHKPLIQLSSMSDVQRILDTGKVPDGREFDIMYSTRGALMSLKPGELRD